MSQNIDHELHLGPCPSHHLNPTYIDLGASCAVDLLFLLSRSLSLLNRRCYLYLHVFLIDVLQSKFPLVIMYFVCECVHEAAAKPMIHVFS